jgi:hypothetical protein
METYATCPYRYFLKEALRIAEILEPEKTEEMERTDRGRLVHHVLESLYGTLSREGLLPLAPAGLARAQAVLDEVAREEFAGAGARGETGFPMLWDLLRDRMLAALNLLIHRDAAGALGAAAAVPVLEAEFGSGEHDEVVVRLANGRLLRFRGAIDRLDLATGNRFLVVDYKVHWDRPPPRPRREDPVFQGGEALQLPIYLLAAPSRIGDACARGARGAAATTSGEGVYARLFLKRGAVELTRALDTEDLAARRADLEAILDTIATGLESGLFPVFPRDGRNCRSCEYTKVCGPAPTITRLYQAKAGDARLERFHAMKAMGSRRGGAGTAPTNPGDEDER